MWILLRLLLVLFGALFRFRAALLPKPIYSSTTDGLQVDIQEKPLKEGLGVTRVFLKVEKKLFFRISPEDRWTKFAKNLGLGTEVQVGDPKFDETFYIVSDHPAFTSALAADTTLRECFLNLRSLGFFEFTSNGFGSIQMSRPGFTLTDQDRGQLLNHLKSLQNSYENIQITLAHLDRRLPFIILFEVLTFALCGYGLGSLIEHQWDQGLYLLDSTFFIRTGLVLSFALLAIWLTCIKLFFAQTSRATLWITELFLTFFLALLLIGPQTLMDLNRVLDSKPPVVTRALVSKKYERTTGSGKSRRTAYFLRVRFKENPFQLPTQVRVEHWNYHSMAEGQGVEFQIGTGYFNQPYVLKLTSIPTPPEFQAAPPPMAPETDSAVASLLPVASWKVDIPTFERHAGPWAEEKYASGAFRQREPLVDGKKNGLARYWHENGVLYGEIFWLNDLKHGCFKLFRSSGTLEQALSYRNGKLHGFSSWYDETGKLVHQELYQDGTLQRLEPSKIAALYEARACP